MASTPSQRRVQALIKQKLSTLSQDERDTFLARATSLPPAERTQFIAAWLKGATGNQEQPIVQETEAQSIAPTVITHDVPPVVEEDSEFEDSSPEDEPPTIVEITDPKANIPEELEEEELEEEELEEEELEREIDSPSHPQREGGEGEEWQRLKDELEEGFESSSHTGSWEDDIQIREPTTDASQGYELSFEYSQEALNAPAFPPLMTEAGVDLFEQKSVIQESLKDELNHIDVAETDSEFTYGVESETIDLETAEGELEEPEGELEEPEEELEEPEEELEEPEAESSDRTALKEEAIEFASEENMTWLYLRSEPITVCEEPPYRNPISTLSDLAHHYDRWKIGRKQSEVFEIRQLWWEPEFEDSLEDFQFEHVIRFVDCSFPSIHFSRISGRSLIFERCQFFGELSFSDTSFTELFSLTECVISGHLSIEVDKENSEHASSEDENDRFCDILQLYNVVINALELKDLCVGSIYIDRSKVHFVGCELTGSGESEYHVSRSILSGELNLHLFHSALIESSALSYLQCISTGDDSSSGHVVSNQAHFNIIWSLLQDVTLVVDQPSATLDIEGCLISQLVDEEGEVIGEGLKVEETTVTGLRLNDLSVFGPQPLRLREVATEALSVIACEAKPQTYLNSPKAFMAVDALPQFSSTESEKSDLGSLVVFDGVVALNVFDHLELRVAELHLNHCSLSHENVEGWSEERMIKIPPKLSISGGSYRHLHLTGQDQEHSCALISILDCSINALTLSAIETEGLFISESDIIELNLINCSVNNELCIDRSSGEILSLMEIDTSAATLSINGGEWGLLSMKEVMANRVIIGPKWLERFELTSSVIDEVLWGDEVMIHQWQVSQSELSHRPLEETEQLEHQEIYLREVFFSDSAMKGALFTQPVITSFVRLDRVSLRDDVFASANLEGECRINQSELIGARVFKGASCLSHLSLTDCFVGEEADQAFRALSVEGKLRFTRLCIGRGLDLEGAKFAETLELNDWTVLIPSEDANNISDAQPVIRPLYHVNLRGATCSHSLVISSPLIISVEPKQADLQRAQGGVRVHLDVDRLSVSERLDLSRFISQRSEEFVGSLSISAQGITLGSLNTPSLTQIASEGGPIAYHSHRSVSGDPQLNLHRMSRVADLYDEYLWASLLADHSIRQGAKAEESLYRAQATSLLLKAVSVASPLSSFCTSPLRWMRFSVLNRRGGYSVLKLLSKLFMISAITVGVLSYGTPGVELSESLRLATIDAWGEPLQRVLGVKLFTTNIAELAPQTQWLITLERLWGIWLLISSLWLGRRLVGEAQLSARLGALLRRP